jgi:hypothetical protein
LKPIVENIPYKDDDNSLMKLEARTLWEFQIDEDDLKKRFVRFNHKFNHIK